MNTTPAQMLFANAEVDYRMGRARALFPQGPRPHRVRRRHTLHLPHRRLRRPLTVA